MGNKESITLLKDDELTTKIKEVEICLKLLKDEQKKRQPKISTDSKKSTINTDKKQTNKPATNKEKTGKSEGTIKATMKDMKKALDDKKIKYKTDISKSDLEVLLRKHNLIRLAETKKAARISNKV